MDAETKKVETDTGGGFFDCNICLATAKDPILSCCGHLFCWPCFYDLSYSYSNVKECPVCKGEVTDTSIVPIYGNGGGDDKSRSILMVPPRPHACRVESLRQQLINHRPFPSTMEERIQLVSNVIGAMGERSDLDVESERNSSRLRSSQSQLVPAEAEEGRSLQVSRLLMQGAASFSSLSSALNSAMDSAERLVEDLETYIQRRQLRRRNSRHSFSSTAANGIDEPEIPSQDTVGEINSNSTSVENRVVDNATDTTSSSSRRRVSDDDNREARRRRLR